MTPIHVRISDNFRRIRKARALTREQLAELVRDRSGLPWTSQTVGMVERRERRLNIVDVFGLGMVGIDIADLMAGIEAPLLADADLDVVEDADRKAARSLSARTRRRVDAEDVVALSRAAWGQTFIRERETRLFERGVDGPTRSLHAHRGHISRQMTAELADLLRGDT